MTNPNPPFNRVVPGGQESSFEHAFMASDEFAGLSFDRRDFISTFPTGRPLGLVVSVNYMDEEGKRFSSAVFNETVQIVDDESAFNPET